MKLFPEEHLIAHLLLAKIYGGKLWKAAYMMTHCRKINNKSYKWVRESNSIYLKNYYKTHPHHSKGIPLSEEHKKKLREAKKDGFSEEHKKKLREAKKDFVPWNKGKKNVQYYSEETKAKMSESAKKRWKKDIKYITPEGNYDTLSSAALANNCSSTKVKNRCTNTKYSDWLIEKKNELS